MNLINFLVSDMLKATSGNTKVDLIYIVKFIDYMLSIVEVNTDDNYQVETLINNFRILNNLYKLLGIITHYSDVEREAFNNDRLIPILDDPSRLLKLQGFRIKLQEKYNEDLIEEFSKYREDHFENTNGAG